MKLFPNTAIPFLFSLIGLGIGYFFSNPLIFNFCQKVYLFKEELVCLDKSIDLIGYPFTNFFALALPVTLFALFVKKEVFKSWISFAAWWIPFSLIAVYLIGTTDNQTFKVIDISYDGTTRFFGILFVWMSFVLFIKSLDFKDKLSSFLTKNIAILILVFVCLIELVIVNQEVFCGSERCLSSSTIFAWNVLFTVTPALAIEICMIFVRFIKRTFVSR